MVKISHCIWEMVSLSDCCWRVSFNIWSYMKVGQSRFIFNKLAQFLWIDMILNVAWWWIFRDQFIIYVHYLLHTSTFEKHLFVVVMILVATGITKEQLVQKDSNPWVDEGLMQNVVMQQVYFVIPHISI